MIKFIKNQIKKYITKKQDKKDLIIFRILALFRYFYLSKYPLEVQYKMAREEIGMLRIAEIDFNKDTLHITLQRPGIFIGRKGENIKAFRELLNKEMKRPIKIELKEPKYLDMLFPYECFWDDLL